MAKKFSIKPTVDAVKHWVVKNAPSIMTGVGVTVLGGAVVVTAVETVKAVRAVDKAKDEKGDDFRPVADTLIEGGKYYILPAGMTIAGSACIIWAHKESMARLASVAAAYALTSEKYDILQDKAREVLGKNKAKELDSATAQEWSDRRQDSVIIMSDGETWFYDPISNTEFKSSTVKIDEAVNKLNHAMAQGGQPYISMNEFQHMLGIPITQNVEDLGWNSNHLLEMRYHAIERNGKPMLSMDYSVKPFPKYDDLYNDAYLNYA